MKLILTKAELLTLLNKRSNLVIDDVEVLDDTLLWKARFDVIVKGIERLDFKVNQKILAIKTLRDMAQTKDFVLGLATAKWGIENWDSFKDFCYGNGRYPADGVLNTNCPM